jgi:hypothetical protein
VALDRAPPEGTISWPQQGAHLSGTITITLEVTDTVSGLDRAIFYARHADRWHHLGADVEHEDGLSLAWDTTSLAGWEDGALTAWVYDRAGNTLELPHVGELAIGSLPAELLATVTSATISAPTASSATVSPSPTWTPTRSVTPLPATPPPTPSNTPTAVATASATHTRVPPTSTPLPTPPKSSPTTLVTPTCTTSAAPGSAERPVPPGFWYLLGGGVLIAGTLVILAFRNLRR